MGLLIFHPLVYGLILIPKSFFCLSVIGQNHFSGEIRAWRPHTSGLLPPSAPGSGRATMRGVRNQAARHSAAPGHSPLTPGPCGFRPRPTAVGQVPFTFWTPIFLQTVVSHLLFGFKLG